MTAKGSKSGTSGLVEIVSEMRLGWGLARIRIDWGGRDGRKEPPVTRCRVAPAVFNQRDRTRQGATTAEREHLPHKHRRRAKSDH